MVPFLYEARRTVLTYPFFVWERRFFLRFSLPFTRIRWKRSRKTHLFESARRSKMVPFSVTIAFSSGRAKKIQKHNVWTRISLKRRKKSPFSSKNGYMWTAPETLVKAIMWETKTRRFSDKKTPRFTLPQLPLDPPSDCPLNPVAPNSDGRYSYLCAVEKD